MSKDAPERVAWCGAELVLDTVECVLPTGHNGPHRIGDLEWEGPSEREHNKALRAENARLREALEKRRWRTVRTSMETYDQCAFCDAYRGAKHKQGCVSELLEDSHE